MNDPKCLIAVPAYKRPQFLPRILACFKRLEYENKRLLIINDDPETKFELTEPDKGIDIINIDKQIQLSVKRNLFASWDFDILFPLDDDDLFLPKRLNNHVKEFQLNPSLDLYRNRTNLTLNSKNLFKGGGGAFTNSSYTRNGYFKSLGYTAFDRSNHDDVSIRTNFNKYCNIKIEQNWNCIDFIYQICDGGFHNSGNSEVMISEQANKNLDRFKRAGIVLLEPDYETYDNIVNMSYEVIKTDKPLDITLSDDKSKVFRTS